MKKITLLLSLLFFATTVVYGQGDKDFSGRTKALGYRLESVAKRNPGLTPAHVYAKQKMVVVDTIVKPTPQQRVQLQELFEKQYQDYSEAYTKYKDGKSAQSKIDLYKIFVKNEEDFRRLLTDDQRLTYTAYNNSIGKPVYFEFRYNFMSDKELLEYKKQLM